MLAHIHLAEALEEPQDCDVQPLVALLGMACLMEALIHDIQQAEQPGTQVSIINLLAEANTSEE